MYASESANTVLEGLTESSVASEGFSFPHCVYIAIITTFESMKSARK